MTETPPPAKPPSKFLDADHPFFRAAWVRWTTALLPLAWAVVEFFTGSPGWGLMFGAVGAWALWVLVIKGPSAPTG